MKERYIKPLSDVQEFPAVDILTNISFPSGGDGPIELPDFPLEQTDYFS